MAATDVFMDTSGFLAPWDASDEYHKAAVDLQKELNSKRDQFFTCDYVVDETATLLLVRHSHKAAADFLDTVERSAALQIEWIGPERFFASAWFFRRHADKEWSFTDCVALTLMGESRTREAFTTDHHFREVGFISLLKR